MLRNLVIATTILLVMVMIATPANNAEQLVFSTSGSSMALSRNNIAGSTPFGFWIWCAGDAASGSNGGYQNFNACQGSMYFYALDHNATHVIDNPDQPLTESGGIYTVNVEEGTAAELFSGNLHPSYKCTLVNETPDGGTTIDVTCQFSSALGGGSGTAHVTGAVVNITGPK